MEVKSSISPSISSVDSISPPIASTDQYPVRSSSADARYGLADTSLQPLGHVSAASVGGVASTNQPAKQSASKSSPATVADFLVSLNLSEYYQEFLNEGFDRMSSVLEVTEEDLSALGVKRGHRRTIQREIASIKGLPYTQTLEIPRRLRDARTDEDSNPPSVADDTERDNRVIQNNSNVIIFKGRQIAVSGEDMEERSKRRYRRHPKPDLNAPDKPPSAYVTFSNGVREELKGTKSFSELARIVGERWKTLDPFKKERLETSAARAKEQYHTALAAYKTTPYYAAFQQYLADFKARHGHQETASKERVSRTSHMPTASFANAQPGTIVPQKRPSSATTEPYLQEDYSDTDSDGSLGMPSNEATFAKQMEDARLKRRRSSTGVASISPMPVMAMPGAPGGPPLFARAFGFEGVSPAAPAVSTTRSTLEPVNAPHAGV